MRQASVEEHSPKNCTTHQLNNGDIAWHVKAQFMWNALDMGFKIHGALHERFSCPQNKPLLAVNTYVANLSCLEKYMGRITAGSALPSKRLTRGDRMEIVACAHLAHLVAATAEEGVRLVDEEQETAA